MTKLCYFPLAVLILILVSVEAMPKRNPKRGKVNGRGVPVEDLWGGIFDDEPGMLVKQDGKHKNFWNDFDDMDWSKASDNIDSDLFDFFDNDDDMFPVDFHDNWDVPIRIAYTDGRKGKGNRKNRRPGRGRKPWKGGKGRWWSSHGSSQKSDSSKHSKSSESCEEEDPIFDLPDDVPDVTTKKDTTTSTTVSPTTTTTTEATTTTSTKAPTLGNCEGSRTCKKKCGTNEPVAPNFSCTPGLVCCEPETYRSCLHECYLELIIASLVEIVLFGVYAFMHKRSVRRKKKT